jgi:hypothetical protein
MSKLNVAQFLKLNFSKHNDEKRKPTMASKHSRARVSALAQATHASRTVGSNL